MAHEMDIIVVIEWFLLPQMTMTQIAIVILDTEDSQIRCLRSINDAGKIGAGKIVISEDI